jgi:propionyl-CoA carboxylase beta chain
MGPEGSVNIIHKGKLTEEKRKEAVENYRQTFANPYKAAELGYIDEIILPKQTRTKLIQALELTRNKSRTNPPKKHGNIPL